MQRWSQRIKRCADRVQTYPPHLLLRILPDRKIKPMNVRLRKTTKNEKTYYVGSGLKMAILASVLIAVSSCGIFGGNSGSSGMKVEYEVNSGPEEGAIVFYTGPGGENESGIVEENSFKKTVRIKRENVSTLCLEYSKGRFEREVYDYGPTTLSIRVNGELKGRATQELFEFETCIAKDRF